MAGRTSGRRRLSLDLLQRAVSDMDLRLPGHHPPSSEVRRVECECCGLSEDCTGGYVRLVRDRFCGRWVCGLCAEAVKEELLRHVVREEAIAAHMEVCRRFTKTVRVNPAMSLASAMAEILRKSSRRGGPGVGGVQKGVCKVSRSYSGV